MSEESNFAAAARAAISSFGLDAVRVLEKRALAHQEAGDREGEAFWAGAASAARAILAGHRKPDITPAARRSGSDSEQGARGQPGAAGDPGPDDGTSSLRPDTGRPGCSTR